jgi:hypothetical protein
MDTDRRAQPALRSVGRSPPRDARLDLHRGVQPARCCCTRAWTAVIAAAEPFRCPGGGPAVGGACEPAVPVPRAADAPCQWAPRRFERWRGRTVRPPAERAPARGRPRPRSGSGRRPARYAACGVRRGPGKRRGGAEAPCGRGPRRAARRPGPRPARCSCASSRAARRRGRFRPVAARGAGGREVGSEQLGESAFSKIGGDGESAGQRVLSAVEACTQPSDCLSGVRRCPSVPGMVVTQLVTHRPASRTMASSRAEVALRL